MKYNKDWREENDEKKCHHQKMLAVIFSKFEILKFKMLAAIFSKLEFF